MLLEFDGTFIFALVSFIIFVLLMNLILYRPVMKIIQAREEFFNKNRDTVSKTKSKTDEVIKKSEDEILSAKKEAAKLLSDVSEVSKTNRENAIKAKKDEIRTKLEDNLLRLNEDKKAVKSALKAEVESYVKAALSKVLGEDREAFSDIKIDGARIDERIDNIREGKK